MLQAYIGDGKGKTTAALGLLIRAVGYGLRCAVIYFDKCSATCQIHETVVLKKLGVPFYIFGCDRFIKQSTEPTELAETIRQPKPHEKKEFLCTNEANQSTEITQHQSSNSKGEPTKEAFKTSFRFGVTEEDRKQAEQALAQAKNLLNRNQVDLLVLDEILTCASNGLLSWPDIENVIVQANDKVEIVCTGRCKDENWLSRFDLISRVCKVRHYYDRGIVARPGIEY